MFVYEYFVIIMISMFDEVLWIIVLMDLVVINEIWICWLCVFEGIVSIFKNKYWYKWYIYLFIWIYFYFYIIVF